MQFGAGNKKIDTRFKYGLFHIDRHYDLLNNLSPNFLEQNRTYISGSSFNDFLGVVGYNKLRYDNYIDSFCRLHPNLIQMVYYATHQEGSDETKTSLDGVLSYRPMLWELPTEIDYWINRANPQIERWILNIDIDFFFQSLIREEGNRQFLTNKYISALCKGIKKSLSKIDVVTIAMSPEFCDGWGSTFNILRHINRELDIPMQFTYKRIKRGSYLF